MTSKLSFKELRERKRQELKKKTVKSVDLKLVVNVPQGEAAMAPRGEQYQLIGTVGLGTCVGVLVIGSDQVGLAHIDSDAVGFVGLLAEYALGTIPDAEKVVIGSSTKLPQPGSSGDRSSTTIYNGLRAVFDGEVQVQVVQSPELGYNLQTGTVLTQLPDISQARRALVPYWSVRHMPGPNGPARIAQG